MNDDSRSRWKMCPDPKLPWPLRYVSEQGRLRRRINNEPIATDENPPELRDPYNGLYMLWDVWQSCKNPNMLVSTYVRGWDIEGQPSIKASMTVSDRNLISQHFQFAFSLFVP